MLEGWFGVDGVVGKRWSRTPLSKGHGDIKIRPFPLNAMAPIQCRPAVALSPFGCPLGDSANEQRIT